MNQPRDSICLLNWTLPDEPELFTMRIPQGFFKSMVEPVVCNLAVKKDGIGAIYDLIAAKPVPFTEKNGRLHFRADLDGVEGRVFALFPEPVASAALLAPSSAAAGTTIQPRFELRGASGSALGVLGSVRLRLRDASGQLLVDWRPCSACGWSLAGADRTSDGRCHGRA